MKYCFICPIHYLELQKPDIHIRLPIGIISNNSEFLKILFSTLISKFNIGAHSIDEIKRGTYYFTNGKSDYCESASDPAWGNFAFALLRQIQAFADNLWGIKDNSVYILDGFLYVYHNDFDDGCTFKKSLTRTASFADTSIRSLSFSEAELLEAGKDPWITVVDGRLTPDTDYKSATQIQYYKESGLIRKEYANMYITMARWAAASPMKLMMYCTAMEALVITSNRFISQTVSKRIALLLGKTEEEREYYYNEIKLSYSIRSKVAHGDFVKEKKEIITALTVRIDTYLRALMKLDIPYSLSDKGIDEFFS